jgi:hypothetical protein
MKAVLILTVSLGAGAALAADGVSTTVLPHTESVLGKSLVASGEKAGRIVDVLADEAGRVRAAVVDFGGFLGVGSRRIAVSWTDLRWNPNSTRDVVETDLPRDRLSKAPEVKPGEPVVAVGARNGNEQRSPQN